MRIGIDVRTMRDDYPGIGRYVYNLVRALQPQLAAGDTLVLIRDPQAPPSRYDLSTQEGITWADLPLPPRALSQQWKLPALLRRLNLDVFHAPYCVTANWGLPCPLVLTLHDLIPLIYPPSMPSPIERLGFRTAVSLAARAARRIIVPSEAVRADLMRLLGSTLGQTAVIPEAPAPVFTPAPDAQVRRTRELYRVPARYFLHVGTNKPHKNIETLLGAYHRYYTAAPAERRLPLVLIGAEDERYGSPRRWAAQWGLARSVLALGDVPDEDLRDLYTGATLVVFPSLHEGFGLPVLEAMACGAPVLAARAPAIPEVAGDAALFLDPRDEPAWAEALTRLPDDAEQLAALKQKSLARAAQFSWAETARATLEIYRGAK